MDPIDQFLEAIKKAEKGIENGSFNPNDDRVRFCRNCE